jgi:hypothetical protein
MTGLNSEQFFYQLFFSFLSFPGAGGLFSFVSDADMLKFVKVGSPFFQEPGQLFNSKSCSVYVLLQYFGLGIVMQGSPQAFLTMRPTHPLGCPD